MILKQVLIELAKSRLSPENDWYCWRIINTKKLPAGITLPPGNQYSRNVALKLALHGAWTSSSVEQRIVLAKYYVSTWGGVKRNKEETLRAYVTRAPNAVIAQGTVGVASWSKVLCIQDPNKYAIFDARVSAALNSLQITGAVAQPMLFPLLSGQNETIKSGNKKLDAHASQHRWTRTRKDTYYRQYLDLVKEAASSCAVPLYTIEMLLFSQAEALLAKAFPNEQF